MMKQLNKGLIFSIQFIMRKPRQQEPEAAGHITSTMGKWRLMNGCAQLTFSWTQAQGMVPPTLGWVLAPQMTLPT